MSSALPESGRPVVVDAWRWHRARLQQRHSGNQLVGAL